MKKPILKLLLVIFISSIISGCATASDRYGFGDVKSMVVSRSGVIPEWDQGMPEDQKVSETIQSMLKNNLTADQSVQIALLYNPSLQATFEDLGIAQANLVQAGLLENPVFEASVRFPDESEDGTNTEFSVSQNFIDIFMVPLRKRVAEEQFEQIKLEVASAVLNHVTMVKMAYYRLQAGEQMLTMRRDVLKASHAAKEFAQRQREAGNISDLDLSIHQSAYHKAKIEFDRNVQEIFALRENLSLDMGIPRDNTDWKIISNLPYVSTIEPSLAELQAQALEQSLALAAAQKEVRVFEKTLEAARLGSMPELSVGANTEREADGARMTGPIFEAEIPIFDLKQQPIVRTKAELRRSQKKLAALKRNIQSEVSLARSELMTAKSAVQYYEKTIVPLQEQIVQLTQEQYNFMLHGTFELLIAKQEEINTRSDYIQSLQDYWVAWSGLEGAVGSKIPYIESKKQSPKKTKKEMNHHQHEHGGQNE